MIYLDNAASSHPKPVAVHEAVARALDLGANPGRSGHRLALEAARTVFETRSLVAELFGVSDPSRIVFTSNATHSLNLALKGSLRPGDHVVTTSMEHNSVLRPLHVLAAGGVAVSVVRADADGWVDPARIASEFRSRTKLVAMTHASNVCGTLQEAAEVGRLCRGAGVLFLLDASQTAGCLPIDVEDLGVHLLAAPGHKGLLGPQGTGILYIAPDVTLSTLLEGGTGSHSQQREMPEEFPEAAEVGTLNTPGIAGLGEGVRYLLDRTAKAVRVGEREVLEFVLGEMLKIPGATVHGPSDPERRTAVVCFNLDGHDGGRLGAVLDDLYGIATRVGLHCAPDAHRTLGTFPCGTVRASFGPFSTINDAEALIKALRQETGNGRGKGRV